MVSRYDFMRPSNEKDANIQSNIRSSLIGFLIFSYIKIEKMTFNISIMKER